MKVKVGDQVKILAGQDKGKEGKVIATYKNLDKVLVEGIHMVKKHQKPNNMNQTGGIFEKEVAIPASRVNIYCSSCKKGVRIRYNVKNNGTKVRVCASCGKELD